MTADVTSTRNGMDMSLDVLPIEQTDKWRVGKAGEKRNLKSFIVNL